MASPTPVIRSVISLTIIMSLATGSLGQTSKPVYQQREPANATTTVDNFLGPAHLTPPTRPH